MAAPAPFPVRHTNPSHVIIEIFGGDNNLNDFVMEDIQEISAGNGGNFSVLALADFAREGAQVIELSPQTGNRVIESPGEIDTGDPETLAAFLARALATYARNVRKAIGFWDHGSGTFDEQDPQETILARRLAAVPRYRRQRSFRAHRLFSRGRTISPRARAMLHDDTSGTLLTNREAGAMLKAAYDRAGLGGQKVDLIFSDTCLNGMVELLTQFDLSRMTANPPADAATWGRQAVEAFGAGYQGRTDQYPCTLAAFRAGPSIADAFARLVTAARAAGPAAFEALDRARRFTQSFASRDTYDLQHFAARVSADPNAGTLKAAADQIVTAVQMGRVHTTALGPTVPNANGLAFWFPSSVHTYMLDRDTYKQLEFEKKTSWAAYLGEIYGG
jgi:hypothetical protein